MKSISKFYFYFYFTYLICFRITSKLFLPPASLSFVFIYRAINKISSCRTYEIIRQSTEPQVAREAPNPPPPPQKILKYSSRPRNVISSIFLHFPAVDVTYINLAFMCCRVFQRCTCIIIVLILPFCYCYFLFNIHFFSGALLVLFYYESSQRSCS